MAFPKPESFPFTDQRISSLYRALGYPARTFILRLLHDHGELTFKEICKRLPISTGAVTEHLRKLMAVSLICVEEVRLENVYSLNIEGLSRLSQMHDNFVNEIVVRNEGGNRAGEVVEAQNDHCQE